MSKPVRLAFAAVAVVVAGLIGLQLFFASGVGDPDSSPSASPSPSPFASVAGDFPAAGPLDIGRHSMVVAGVRLSLALPTDGWVSNGQWGIDRDRTDAAQAADFIFWTDSAPDRIFAEPCAGTPVDPRVGPSAADRAAAVASIPGTELVSGPSAVTIGGYPAQRVVIKIPADIGCAPDRFFLWEDTDAHHAVRYATERDSTIRVWIIDVDGTIVWIDGETFEASSAEAAQGMEQIVNSIEFD